MEFSPNDDVQKLLIKSATEAQPKREGTTSSRRAELRVRSDTYAFSTPLSHLRTHQRVKQGKLKEKRKKIKAKKAVGIANTKAKKAVKTTNISGSTSDVDEVARPSKRAKIASSSARESTVHSAFLHAEKKKLANKGAQKSKETMKSHIPGKSKRAEATDR